MATRTIPVEKSKVEIQTATTGTFADIGGLTQIQVTSNSTMTDTATMDGTSSNRNVPVRRGHTVTLTGMVEEDATSGERDAGQARVEVLARDVGYDAEETFRIVDRDTSDVEVTFVACVDAQSLGIIGGGGDKNSHNSWTCTLNVNGVPVIT